MPGPLARPVAANVRPAQIAQCGHYPAEEQPAERKSGSQLTLSP